MQKVETAGDLKHYKHDYEHEIEHRQVITNSRVEDSGERRGGAGMAFPLSESLEQACM